MFEENQPTQPVTQSAVAQTPVQQSSPQEPTDMFAQSEASNPVVPNAAGASSPEQYMFEEEPDEKPWFLQKKVIFIALGSVLLLIIIIFGVQFALTYFKTQGAQTQPQSQTQQQTTPVQQQDQVPPAVTQPSTETQPVLPQGEQPGGQAVSPETQQQVPPINGAPSVSTTPTVGVDTDGDGLTDAEETALGTDPTITDTDMDGLTDREEVKVFFTDSRNPDTDSDGYLDGLEVKNGFNPKGDGKLPPLPGEAAQPVQ